MPYPPGFWRVSSGEGRLAEEQSEKRAQELGEELADIIFAVICLANSEGIDLQASLQQVIDKVWVRDRDRYD